MMLGKAFRRLVFTLAILQLRVSITLCVLVYTYDGCYLHQADMVYLPPITLPVKLNL